jgi:hypothetical protein
LERFPGYTYTSLMDEDSEFLKLVKIEALGRPSETPDGPPPSDSPAW